MAHRIGREGQGKASDEPCPEWSQDMLAQYTLVDTRVLVLVYSGQLLFGDSHLVKAKMPIQQKRPEDKGGEGGVRMKQFKREFDMVSFFCWKLCFF